MPTSATQKKARAQRAREFLDSLIERYPACLTRKPEEIRPLAVGIQKTIREDLAADPEWADTPNWVVRQALARYTRSAAYLRSIMERKPRVGLDGGEAGEITDQEQAHAKERHEQLLADRAARQEARRRPRKKPQAPRARRAPQQKAEEKTQKKLEQLLTKFNSN